MTQIVGVIGLGNMGRGIAKNIANAHTLLVWDEIEDARSPFAATARVAEPAQMAAEADIIICLLYTSPSPRDRG